METIDLQEAAKNKSFLGFFRNQDGEIYCTVYDSTILSVTEKNIIKYDQNGILGDVWNQVAFMTPEEFRNLGGSI